MLFQLGGNLDFLQKMFYNIFHRSEDQAQWRDIQIGVHDSSKPRSDKKLWKLRPKNLPSSGLKRLRGFLPQNFRLKMNVSLFWKNRIGWHDSLTLFTKMICLKTSLVFFLLIIKYYLGKPVPLPFSEPSVQPLY